MLRIDMKPGEGVKIGDYATITLEEKSGKAARLAIEADRSIPITRVGIYPQDEPRKIGIFPGQK